MTSPARKERFLSWLMGDRPHVRAFGGPWMSAVIDAHCPIRLAFPNSVTNSTLEAVRAPTLVMLGGEDGLVGDAETAARRARAHIGGAEIEIVAESTHALMIEEPRRVAYHIVRFFEQPVRIQPTIDVVNAPGKSS